MSAIKSRDLEPPELQYLLPLDENISEADLYQLALDGKITISVYFRLAQKQNLGS